MSFTRPRASPNLQLLSRELTCASFGNHNHVRPPLFTMTAPKAEFASLPREVRNIIWENILTPPRLVVLNGLCRMRLGHLNDSARRTYKLWFQDQQVGESQRVEPGDITHSLNLRERYPPPVITHICHESRRFALDAGYFLLPAWDGSDEDASGQGPGATWLNGAADVLYIESSRVPLFFTRIPFRIPNAVRVRSVGVDWMYVQGGAGMSPVGWRSHSARMVLRWRLIPL